MFSLCSLFGAGARGSADTWDLWHQHRGVSPDAAEQTQSYSWVGSFCLQMFRTSESPLCLHVGGWGGQSYRIGLFVSANAGLDSMFPLELHNNPAPPPSWKMEIWCLTGEVGAGHAVCLCLLPLCTYSASTRLFSFILYFIWLLTKQSILATEHVEEPYAATSTWAVTWRCARINQRGHDIETKIKALTWILRLVEHGFSVFVSRMFCHMVCERWNFSLTLTLVVSDTWVKL